MTQCVISHCFNCAEHGHSSAAEHLDVYPQMGIHLLRQRQSLREKPARIGNQLLHQVGVAFVESPLDDVALRDPVLCRHAERNVNPPLVQIARNVLPEIRQLQRGAGSVR